MPRKFATDLDAELMREIRTSTQGGGHEVDEETRGIMEAQSERLYGETKAVRARLKLLTEHLVGKLLEAGEMSLNEALSEIRSFEARLMQLQLMRRSAIVLPRTAAWFTFFTCMSMAHADVFGDGDRVMLEFGPYVAHRVDNQGHNQWPHLVGVEWESGSHWLVGDPRGSGL